MIFSTNNTERMRILNSGFMGVGTTTPANILHLNIPSSSAV
jgi:hypothetical protein